MRRSVWRRRIGFPGRLQATLFVALLGIAGVVAMHPSAPAETMTARAEAIDGDTLRLASERVRLTGLDAPELDQTCVDADGGEWRCGNEARAFLAGLLASGTTACTISGRDTYSRALAHCSIAGDDLGGRIVSAGWAVADLGYAGEEAVARDDRRGIWRGSFVSPAQWRRSHGNAPPVLWEWIRSWFQ